VGQASLKPQERGVAGRRACSVWACGAGAQSFPGKHWQVGKSLDRETSDDVPHRRQCQL
jgi:hypothetical protein